MLHVDTADGVGKLTAARRKKMRVKKSGKTVATSKPSFKITQESCKCLPASLPEIKMLMMIVSAMAWINMLVGIPSIIFYPIVHNFSLLSTGLLSLLTFWLLRIRVRKAMKSGTWIDICITAVCGIYFPSFVLWVSVINLFSAIHASLVMAQRTLPM